MQVSGACHCGAVTFSAEVDEAKVIICHCTDCQVLSASAFRFGALVRKVTFAVQGPTKEYCKIGSSGVRRIQVFCPECATGIHSYTPDLADPYISLRLGGVHQRDQLIPRNQIWRQSALSWVDDLASIPGCARQEVLAAEIAERRAD